MEDFNPRNPRRYLVFSIACYALLLTSGGAHAQGQFYFNNRVPPDIIAPVLRPDGRGAGSNVTAQVFHVRDDGTLQPLFPTTTFRTEPAEAACYVLGVTVTVPGVPAPIFVDNDFQFTSATFRVRAWEGADWDGATLRGESNDVTIRVGGDFWPAPNLDGLQGFTLHPRITLALDFPPAMAMVRSVRSRIAGVALVQSSDDLINWVDVSQSPVVGGVISFQVFASENRKFYRALLN